MHPTRTILALALTSLATAAPQSWGKCNTFTLYCGHTLEGLGWSSALIQSRVALDSWNEGHVPSTEQVDQSLFKCAGQGESLVWVNSRSPCGNCVDGGAGKSDYCG